MDLKPVIAVPVDALVPADIGIPFINEGSFLEKLNANNAEDVSILGLTVEELIALVEKPHLFGTDVIALTGLPGARYDAVWSSYIAPLRRLTLESFKPELKKIMDALKPTGKDPLGPVSGIKVAMNPGDLPTPRSPRGPSDPEVSTPENDPDNS